jgi:HD-GYP domain-containing protein (c-di-GMP phosphodiesterase class II)
VQFTIADHIRQRPVDNAKKIKAYRHLISTVSQNAVVNSLRPEDLQKSLAAFEGYTEMAFSNKQLSDMMVSVFSELPDQAERNAVVAVIALSLANLWQWSSAKTQSRIVLGAMLCDVGLKDNPHLMTAKKSDLSREEQKIYEEHPYVGYKTLSELGDVPDEVLQIVLQHHENGIGTGFPQKLAKKNIHSFAKLVHGVHEFVEIMSHQKDKKNIKMAIDHLYLCQRKIVSEQVIKSLYLLFHISVPVEIETMILPDKSGRLI